MTLKQFSLNPAAPKEETPRNDRLSDGEMMRIAAAGARALTGGRPKMPNVQCGEVRPAVMFHYSVNP
jgi:hypothetical protein